jgi:hypothetical protein
MPVIPYFLSLFDNDFPKSLANVRPDGPRRGVDGSASHEAPTRPLLETRCKYTSFLRENQEIRGIKQGWPEIIFERAASGYGSRVNVPKTAMDVGTWSPPAMAHGRNHPRWRPSAKVPALLLRKSVRRRPHPAFRGQKCSSATRFYTLAFEALPPLGAGRR